MVSIPACHAGDPGSIPGFGGYFFHLDQLGPKNVKKQTDPRGNRTPNLRVWNPTRCHCAMESSHYQSAYSSVGRAGDCRWLQLISLGHWFDSGCADLFCRESLWPNG